MARADTEGGAVTVGAGRSRMMVLAVCIALAVLVTGCGAADGADGDSEAADDKEAAATAGDGAESEAGGDNGDNEEAGGSDPGEAEVAAMVSTLADEVGQVRGLEPQSDFTVDLVTQDELGDVARDLAERQERNPALDEDVWAALRLIPEDTDFGELTDRFVDSAGEGLYDAQAAQLYVAAEGWPLEPSGRAAAAHEVTHALQDQHFDLARMQDLARDAPDTAMALRYLVEGDALTVQQQWLRSHLTTQERQQYMAEGLRQQQESQEVAADLPPAVVLDGQLPYLVGSEFVQTVRRERGREAVDAALQDPPATSVEIYDPELYLEGFQPRQVGGLARPGEQWAEHAAAPFGAHMVAMMQPPVQAMQGELPTASAWRGGKLRAWRSGDDVAVGVATTFAEDGAAAFCDRVQTWYREQADADPAGDGALQSSRDAMAVNCGDREVRAAIAPTVETARAIVDG